MAGKWTVSMICLLKPSMDWFKGKSTGNHGFYHQIQGFPVNFPIIQFYETSIGSIFPMFDDTGSWFMATKGRWKTWTPGNYGGNVIEVTSWRHTWHLFGGVQKSLPIICKHVGGMNQQLWKYIYIYIELQDDPQENGHELHNGKNMLGKKISELGILCSDKLNKCWILVLTIWCSYVCI